ncbi:MAG: hypothetical protein ACTSSI_02190 [Candidatus Helarchaeota archaeon]
MNEEKVGTQDSMTKEDESSSRKYLYLTIGLSIASIIGIVLYTSYYANIILRILACVVVILYISISLALSIVHYSNNKIMKLFNSLLRYLLPINDEKISSGLTAILRFIYMICFGIIITLILYAFTPLFYVNLSVKTTGFFSFVLFSGSFVPLLIFFLVIISPPIFCFLFLWAALSHDDVEKQKIAPLIIFLPFLFFLSTFVQLIINLSFLVLMIIGTNALSLIFIQVIGLWTLMFPILLFLIAWTITLILWYGKGTKKNILMCLGIGFTQALASVFIFYNLLIKQLLYARDLSTMVPIQPIYFIWLAVLIFIPVIIKVFDRQEHHRVIGVGLAIIAAFIFQTLSFGLNFINLLALSVPSFHVEIFLGFGYFYYWFFLFLIPPFFLFGYFQILIIKSIYRMFRDYAAKKKGSWKKFIKITGLVFTIAALCIWIIGYYIIFYWNDYIAAFVTIGLVFSGQMFSILGALGRGAIIFADVAFLYTFDFRFPISMLITMSLMVYSAFRTAYNLTIDDEKKDTDKEEMGLLSGSGSYKSRIILGFGLVALFIGTIAIYSFLQLYLATVTNFYIGLGLSPNAPPLSQIKLFLAFVDNVKLIISMIGFITGLVFFIKYLKKN